MELYITYELGLAEDFGLKRSSAMPSLINVVIKWAQSVALVKMFNKWSGEDFWSYVFLYEVAIYFSVFVLSWFMKHEIWSNIYIYSCLIITRGIHLSRYNKSHLINGTLLYHLTWCLCHCLIISFYTGSSDNCLYLALPSYKISTNHHTIPSCWPLILGWTCLICTTVPSNIKMVSFSLWWFKLSKCMIYNV